jgi:predicted metalloprotease
MRTVCAVADRGAVGCDGRLPRRGEVRALSTDLGQQRANTVYGGSPRRGVEFLVPALVVLLVVALVILALSVRHGRASNVTTLSDRRGDLSTAERVTVDSVTQYWLQAMPATYGRPFRELSGGYQPKTPSSPPWTCNGQRVTYNGIKGNAFYCGGAHDDYVAYDASFLFPQLNRIFGSVSPAVVLAHETGHAVQHRAGVQAPSIVIEMQADCFAGAWTRFAQRSSDDPVALTAGALDSSVAVMLTLRDQVGTPATNPQAHGLGFDRVNAYQTGYDHGAASCARFPRQPPPTTELPFHTLAEALTGGNLPYEQAVPLFDRSLNDFWKGAFPAVRPGATFRTPRAVPIPVAPLPACGGAAAPDRDVALHYCPEDNSIQWVDPLLRRLHVQLGDTATGTILSDGWGRAAQTQAGRPTSGRRAGLQRDCYTGAWLSTIANGKEPLLQLSPGDLDEALTTIVASSFRPGAEEQGSRGGAFERTDALRSGVLGGISACH